MNRLINETSPYLLQHAHNPVHWYPWGEEAFEKAIEEDKPVLVSIGYSACHWCHVMERESFEDATVANYMNSHFINIKVDREERPDVDHIYMDALQAMEGSGGWPLNMFVLPDRRPFFGGTYFPPRRAFNRASWSEVLQSVAKAYTENRNEINEQAHNLTQHLRQSNDLIIARSAEDLPDFELAVRNIMQTADREWGGFGKAPKFPHTFIINFLLHYAAEEKNGEAEEQALVSLKKMMEGGIYDHIGGGFARYSTDREWLAPHFEKMLYDNALLIISLSEAYQFTNNKIYAQVIDETLQFVQRELLSPEGGFYSALDADSEGEEGRFYVWSEDEAREVVGAQNAAIILKYFDVSPQGNWEGKNILRTLRPQDEFVRDEGLNGAEFEALVANAKQRMLERRAMRVRPGLDDKILLSWNALMNLAFSKAYGATGREEYLAVSIRNMQYLVSNFVNPDGTVKHLLRKNGPGFLDDSAYLIEALLELAQVSGDLPFLDKAEEIMKRALADFEDNGTGMFFYTSRMQSDVPVRKKEIYDGATPSANSVMAYNLYRLSILLDRNEWRERAVNMATDMTEVAVKYPSSFGNWLTLLFEMSKGTNEIAVLGNDWKNSLKKIQRIHISHKLALASQSSLDKYPLLANKNSESKIHIYLCRNYACSKPVDTVDEFTKLLQLN